MIEEEPAATEVSTEAIVGDRVTQSAILLMTLGEEDAAEVLKHMGPKEVQRIGSAMAKLHSVTREQVQIVLRNFIEMVRDQTSLGVGTEGYIRNMLVTALGEDKASGLVDRILMGGNTSGLDTLKWMDARAVSDLIRYEHPQIQAIVIAYLDPDQSAEVLQYLDERMRLDILMRISAIDTIQPQALQELNDIFEKQFASTSTNASAQLGGIKRTADIMNYLETSAEAQLMDSIREMDEDMAQEIQDLMFVFDNLRDLDDRSMQTMLREVANESLMLALKGSDDQMKEKIFANMSKRAADLMRDDLEAMGPVKISDVESAQKEILTIARRMGETGEIMLGGKGGEEMI